MLSYLERNGRIRLFLTIESRFSSMEFSKLFLYTSRKTESNFTQECPSCGFHTREKKAQWKKSMNVSFVDTLSQEILPR